MSATAHHRNVSPTNLGSVPFYSSPSSWAEALAPLLEEIDKRSRQVAREEYELLLSEQAAAASEADKNELLYTVQEGAELLNVRPQTVYEWIKVNKLRALKIGRSVRLKRGDIMSALQAQIQPDGRRKYARRGQKQRPR